MDSFDIDDILLKPLQRLSDDQIKKLHTHTSRELFKRVRVRAAKDNQVRTFVLHFADGESKEVSGRGADRETALSDAVRKAGCELKELDYWCEVKWIIGAR